jgi:hypothetical protein
MTQAQEDLANAEADINSAVMRQSAEPSPPPQPAPPQVKGEEKA